MGSPVSRSVRAGTGGPGSRPWLHLQDGTPGNKATCSVVTPLCCENTVSQPMARPERGQAQGHGAPAVLLQLEFGVSGPAQQGSGSLFALAAPAHLRARDVRPVAGRGQAHPAVRQPQDRAPEGGRSVRGFLLTRAVRPGPAARGGRGLSSCGPRGDVRCPGHRLLPAAGASRSRALGGRGAASRHRVVWRGLRRLSRPP